MKLGSGSSGSAALGYLVLLAVAIVCALLLLWALRSAPGRESPASESQTGPNARELPQRSLPGPGHSATPSSQETFSLEEERGDSDANYFPEVKTYPVNGRIMLRGQPPPEKRLPLNGPCAVEHPNGATTSFYVVSADGGLGDVLVFISEGLPEREWPMPGQPRVLTQKGCLYEPYISAARAGQLIQIRNLSPIMHNVHITPNVLGNVEANRAQLPNAAPLEFVLDQPELFVRFQCDVHPWENHYLSTFDHPFFAVTDENGEFSLPPLPAGDYVIEARHRKAGVQKQELQLREDPESLTIWYDAD